MANGKLSHEEFITNAIKALRKDGNKGIHTVSSGFIVGFKKYYGGEDPMPIIEDMIAEGKLDMRPEGNGQMIYFAGEAPVETPPAPAPTVAPPPEPEPEPTPEPPVVTAPAPESSVEAQLEVPEPAADDLEVEAEVEVVAEEDAVATEEEPLEVATEEEPIDVQDESVDTQTTGELPALQAPETPGEKPSKKKKSHKGGLNIAVQQIQSTEEHISNARPGGLSIPELEVAQILQEVEVFTTRADETPQAHETQSPKHEKKKIALPEKKLERWAFRGVSGAFSPEQLTLFSQEAARILKDKHGVLTEWARLHSGSEFHVDLNSGSRRTQIIYLTQRTRPATGYRYIQVLCYVAPVRDETLKDLLRGNSSSDFEWVCLMEHCGDEYIALKGVLEYERCNPVSMADAVLYMAKQAGLLELKLADTE